MLAQFSDLFYEFFKAIQFQEKQQLFNFLQFLLLFIYLTAYYEHFIVHICSEDIYMCHHFDLLIETKIHI